MAHCLLGGSAMRHLSLFAIATMFSAMACTDGGDDLHCDDNGENCVDESSGFEQAYEEGQQPGKADGTDCSGVRIPDRNGFGKRIALTFDDGPNPATTPRVIEILKAHHAPATFFINGVKLGVPGAKELAARVAADPDFILGNHSQNHLDFATLSLSKAATEMDRTAEAVTAAGEPMHWFRFPFGSSTCATMNLVKQRGWTAVGWHIDSADWCYAAGGGVCKKSTFKYVPDSQRSNMLGYIMSQVASTGGGVILFHDIHANTANNLDTVLTTLEQAGYTFVRVDDLRTFPRLNGVTPKFIGDVCSTDAQCSFTANGEAGHCSAAGFCTVSCNGSCPDADGKAPTFCIADAAATNKGMCVSKSNALNNSCALLPNTTRRDADRFIGTSSAAPARANVCAPR
jgi:peptidoglycan/xylan/chitin deacetylase (PgdA/CDA1 family)